jgi:hypothetical protein
MTPLTDRQRALLSAAARHVRDAERLLVVTPTSPDQAWHLAGFGPECVRKACLEDAILDLALGHDLGPQGEVLLEWWIPLDPSAWRYHLAGWAQHTPRLAEWNPSHRYESTGTRFGGPVRELTERARQLLDGVVADLWSDGRLREGEL